MNIFVVDQDTMKCAEALDDLRLNKMIIETAQLLSTAMRVRGYTEDNIYKSTHVNHPCAVWVRENISNYSWTLLYLSDLVEERIRRTGKSHKTYEIYNALCAGPKIMPKGELTPFVNCSTYKDLEVLEAYKKCLIDKWAADIKPPKWTNSNKPKWAQ